MRLRRYRLRGNSAGCRVDIRAAFLSIAQLERVLSRSSRALTAAVVSETATVLLGVVRLRPRVERGIGLGDEALEGGHIDASDMLRREPGARHLRAFREERAEPRRHEAGAGHERAYERGCLGQTGEDFGGGGPVAGSVVRNGRFLKCLNTGRREQDAHTCHVFFALEPISVVASTLIK